LSVAILTPAGDACTTAGNLADLDEPTLVERAKSRDSDAIGELYRRHHSAVCGCVKALMRTQLDDVEDVASEVWIRALKAIASFRNDGSGTFKSWLYGIARFTVIDWHHQRARRREEPEAEVDPGIDLSWRGRPEALVLDRVEVQDLLAELAPRLRQILLLRFGCDLTIPETSRIMRAAEAAVIGERTSEMMVGWLTKRAFAAVNERMAAREVRRRGRRFMADPNATWQSPAATTAREAA